MKVVAVPVASRGVDTVTAIAASTAAQLKSSGVDFVVRYLGSISAGELEGILGAGLSLQLVTYSRAPGWSPDAAIGATDGASDVAHLKALGVPLGMLVWIDLEGVAQTAAVSDVIAWLNARSQALVAAGYIAGVYVGSSCVLNGPQLFSLPHVTRYWRAFNAGIPEPSCGWCQQQLFQPDLMLDGVEIDYDFTQADYSGRTPLALSSSS